MNGLNEVFEDSCSLDLARMFGSGFFVVCMRGITVDPWARDIGSMSPSPTASTLRLKVRLLKAEMVETLPYGCMTWSPKNPDYERLRRVHRSMLLRCLGRRKRKRDGHNLSSADALAQTDSERVEAIVRKRRILFAGFVARMGEERLPQRVMYGEFVGGKGYSGGAGERLDGSSEGGYVGL